MSRAYASRVTETKPSLLWPTLLALTGLNLFNYLDRQVLSAVVPRIQGEFHLTDNRVGSLATAFMLGYFVTSPFFGYLGDRMARKWLIAGGVAVWSLGTIFSGMATGFWSLIAFRVLVGFGEASYATLSPGWIADLYSPARRNNALAIFYIAIPVGAALGQIIGGRVEESWGWRAAFYFAGAPGLLLALGVLLLHEPARGASEPASPAATPKVSTETQGFRAYLRLYQYPTYRLVVAGYVAQTFAMGGFAFWSAKFLYEAHGMQLKAADDFFGVALVLTGLTATLAGGFVATWWRARHPAGYAWVLALSALAAVPTAFAAFLLDDLTLAKAALAATMFFLFLSTGPVNTLILESVPVAMRASAMAASIFLIHAFGDLPSFNIVGLLSDNLGGLKKAMLILPAALAVSAVLWLWLAVRTQREERVNT